MRRRTITVLLLMSVLAIIAAGTSTEVTNAEEVTSNKSLFFTADGEITPLVPEEFELDIIPSFQEGIFGYGIIPRDTAEYVEVGIFETGQLQAPLNFFSDMTMEFPMICNGSIYFDLRVSLLLNGVAFAPQQEINNEVATDELEIWELTFKTQNKRVPSGGNLKVVVEVRTNEEGISMVSRESDTLGIDVESDMIDIIEVHYPSEEELTIEFKECFDVPLEELHITSLTIDSDDFLFFWDITVRGPELIDTDSGFRITLEEYLEPGDYFIEWHCCYNGEYGSPSCSDTYYFTLDETETPEDPDILTAEECRRYYDDIGSDTWDLEIYTTGGMTEGHMTMKRGISRCADIRSVSSYREEEQLVIEISLAGNAEDLERYEIYLVEPDFTMPMMTYRLSWEGDLPELFPEMDCCLSTNIEANGSWWLPSDEYELMKIIVRDDLDSLMYGDLPPDFEIFVIAVDGYVDTGGYDVNGAVHWDYAGYNVIEPEFEGETKISIYEEAEETIKDKVIDLAKRLLILAVGMVVLMIVIIVTIIAAVMGGGRRRRRSSYA